MVKGDFSTVKRNTDISFHITNFGISGNDTSTWNIISPTEIIASYKEELNAPDNFNNTTIDLRVTPVDVSVIFGDIEKILECCMKAFMNIVNYLPKVSSVPEKNIQEIRVKPLTAKENIKVSANLEQFKLIVVNDKKEIKYALGSFHLTDFKASLGQSKDNDKVISQELSSSITSIRSELANIQDEKHVQSFM